MWKLYNRRSHRTAPSKLSQTPGANGQRIGANGRPEGRFRKPVERRSPPREDVPRKKVPGRGIILVDGLSFFQMLPLRDTCAVRRIACVIRPCSTAPIHPRLILGRPIE